MKRAKAEIKNKWDIHFMYKYKTVWQCIVNRYHGYVWTLPAGLLTATRKLQMAETGNYTQGWVNPWLFICSHCSSTTSLSKGTTFCGELLLPRRLVHRQLSCCSTQQSYSSMVRLCHHWRGADLLNRRPDPEWWHLAHPRGLTQDPSLLPSL